MTKTNSKKALLSSVFALVLSVAMLIGTTFAWFTDTASTGVNKIVSGNLKVDIIGENSDSHIEKLNFKKAAATDAEAGAAILWEPGCRYLTEGFRIANKGNLALKWKAQVNKGTTAANEGNFDLLDVIDFYLVTKAADGTETETALDEFTGNLKKTETSDVYYIKGVMQTTAGNDYQGLTLDGITITVYAMQDTVENDSFGNQYDANADMTPDNLDLMTVDGVAVGDLTSAVTAASEGSTITFCKSTSESMKLDLTAPMELKGITFKALSGVSIHGLQLASTSAKTRLTLDGIKFEGISFTDRVVIGQDRSSYGLSKCTDITFDNCKFNLATSTEKYPDAIKRMGATVSGTISEKETVAYLNGLTIKNCEFTNVRYGVFCGKVRNTTVENCTFTNCSSHAVRFEDVAGKLNVIGNTVNKAGGVLSINTVGNNYSTTDIQTDVTIKGNNAVGMTCQNGYVFVTAYDNAKKSGKSTYTITGNSCTYTQSFDEPLNGFRIKSTYGPSVAEFIENK